MSPKNKRVPRLCLIDHEFIATDDIQLWFDTEAPSSRRSNPEAYRPVLDVFGKPCWPHQAYETLQQYINDEPTGLVQRLSRAGKPKLVHYLGWDTLGDHIETYFRNAKEPIRPYTFYQQFTPIYRDNPRSVSVDDETGEEIPVWRTANNKKDYQAFEYYRLTGQFLPRLHWFWTRPAIPHLAIFRTALNHVRKDNHLNPGIDLDINPLAKWLYRSAQFQVPLARQYQKQLRDWRKQDHAASIIQPGKPLVEFPVIPYRSEHYQYFVAHSAAAFHENATPFNAR